MFYCRKGPSINFLGPEKRPFPGGSPVGYPAQKVYVHIFSPLFLARPINSRNNSVRSTKFQVLAPFPSTFLRKAYIELGGGGGRLCRNFSPDLVNFSLLSQPLSRFDRALSALCRSCKFKRTNFLAIGRPFLRRPPDYSSKLCPHKI